MHAVVIGLAETGIAVTRRLRAEGWDVTVLDDAPGPGEKYAARVAEAGALGARVLERPTSGVTADVAGAADLVVPSPLVRLDHGALTAARAASVPVRSEIDLAAERTDAPVVAVTGTNGKTTVTTLIAEMLQASGRNAIAAGNVGRPLIDAVGDAADVFVAEVSSFQLACSETFHPRVAVLLAITPDHLDWHGGYPEYVAAKARITRLQTAGDLLVFDADDDDATGIAHAANARTVGFSKRSDAVGCAGEVGGELLAPDGTPLAAVAGMRRALVHDRTNALAAALAAMEVGATTVGVRDALASYVTLPHRVALVGKAGGVSWYDDSKATNPDATLPRARIVRLGRAPRGRPEQGPRPRRARARRARVRGVVAFGEAAPEVAAAFTGVAEVVTAGSMHDAVRAAAGMAQPGDAVLLSPACASFDAYTSYAERGDDFAAEVRGLLVEGASSR